MRFRADVFVHDQIDFRFGGGLPCLGEVEDGGRVEGTADAKPWRSVEDEANLEVATPTYGAEVFIKAPSVETSSGAFNAAFIQRFVAYALDMRQVSADADEKAVVEVEAAGKGPGFGAPYVITFLTLPDVAGWHGAVVIRLSACVLVDGSKQDRWCRGRTLVNHLQRSRRFVPDNRRSLNY